MTEGDNLKTKSGYKARRVEVKVADYKTIRIPKEEFVAFKKAVFWRYEGETYDNFGKRAIKALRAETRVLIKEMTPEQRKSYERDSPIKINDDDISR